MTHGEITLPFGNGEYNFCVAKHKQLFELQDKCGLHATGTQGEDILIPSGPMEIFTRLRNGTWREADVREPIRLGLLGAGMQLPELKKLLAEFVDDQPLGNLAPVASRIVFAAVFGVQGDELGKEEADQTKKEVPEQGTSSDPQPTEPALP